MEKVFLRNGEELIIRKATLEDSEKMVGYMIAIGGESDYLTFGKNELKITTEIQEKIIEATNSKDNSIMLLGFIENEIVGSIVFRGGERDRVKHVGEIGITVRKHYWNYGIGGRLLSFLINWAKGNGIVRKINLRVRADNENAIKLYEKYGFIKEGVLSRDFCVDGKFYDSIQMGLNID